MWRAGAYASDLATVGTTIPGATSGSPADGYKFGTIFTLGQSGTAVDFGFYATGGSAAEHLVPVVYNADSAGNPTTLALTGADVVVAAGQAAGWVRSTLPTTTLAPGKYLLGLLSGPTGSGAAISLRPRPGERVVQPEPVPDAVVVLGDAERVEPVAERVPRVPAGKRAADPAAEQRAAGDQRDGAAGADAGGEQRRVDDSPTGYAYQWRRCDTSGGAAAPTSPARPARTTCWRPPTSARRCAWSVTATNAGGPAAPPTSAATGVVSAAAAGLPPGTTTARHRRRLQRLHA